MEQEQRDHYIAMALHHFFNTFHPVFGEQEKDDIASIVMEMPEWDQKAIRANEALKRLMEEKDSFARSLR